MEARQDIKLFNTEEIDLLFYCLIIFLKIQYFYYVKSVCVNSKNIDVK